MRIVSISDTHSDHRSLVIPECDVLIHSGDTVTNFDIDDVASGKSMVKFRDFLDWFAEQPARYKMFIGGNHDFGLSIESYGFRKSYEEAIGDDIIYLRDSEFVVDGVKFYGTPFQPYFCGMAFNIKEHAGREAKMNLIPDDTNVLLTHMPPKGIMDRVFGMHEKKWIYCGCGALTKRLPELKQLKIHAFGHVHSTRGAKSIGGVWHVNSAICGANPYRAVNRPYVIDIIDGKVFSVKDDY